MYRAVKRNNSEPFLKNNYSIDSTMITTTKTTGLMLGMLAIAGLQTTSGLTTATTITAAAFADSNAISKLREYLQPLWGSLSRQAVPPHRYKGRTD
jgi:hypothetical protein